MTVQNSWEKYKLSEVTSKLGDGLHGTPKYDENGEYFFINGNNLNNGKIIIKPDTKKVNKSEFLKYKKELNDRTILISINGTLGNIAFYNNEKIILGKSACYFNLNNNISKRFIKHLMSSKDFKIFLENYATGATIKNVSLEAMRNFEFLCPELHIQQKIASILSAYDDLIENNIRRINILEEIAQSLYKEWFVNFRFTNHENVKMVEYELGLIPEGWEVKKLEEICSKVTDGTHDTPKPVEEGYYLVTGKHIVNGFIDFSQCYCISKEDHDKVMLRSKPEKGDIIFSNIGTLGSTVLVDQIFEYSIKNVALFKPLNPEISYYLYQYLIYPQILEAMHQQATGTSQKFFSLNFLRPLRIIMPENTVLKDFRKQIEPILKQRSLLNIKNQNLRKTRDLLLPRLISGEIDVEEITIGGKNEQLLSC